MSEIDTSDLVEFLLPYLPSEGQEPYFYVDRPAQRPLRADDQWRRAHNRHWIEWERTEYGVPTANEIRVHYRFTVLGLRSLGVLLVDDDHVGLTDDEDFVFLYDGEPV